MRPNELRSQNREALNAEDRGRHARQAEHRIGSKLLNDAGVPCGSINTIDQTFAEPQVNHLGIAKRVRHPKHGDIEVVGQPITLSKAMQPQEYRPTPELGQHTGEILAGLGYDAAAIAGLRAHGVV